jgi:hypothetical protein
VAVYGGDFRGGEGLEEKGFYGAEGLGGGDVEENGGFVVLEAEEEG